MTDTFHLRTITYLPIGLVLNRCVPPLSQPEYSLKVGSRKLGGYPAARKRSRRMLLQEYLVIKEKQLDLELE
jgi:hypothetical protein